MAAGRIAAPGTPAGPCLEACNHPDCAANRALAARLCPYCSEPIGYEREFVWFSTDPWHADCWEQALERR